MQRALTGIVDRRVDFKTSGFPSRAQTAKADSTT